MLAAVTNSEFYHYGSTAQGPVASTINHSSVFVKINSMDVLTTADTIDTPSHIYDYDNEGNPLYHSHNNQVIDVHNNNYVKIDGYYVVVVGDKNSSNDTRITATNQDFVNVM